METRYYLIFPTLLVLVAAECSDLIHSISSCQHSKLSFSNRADFSEAFNMFNLEFGLKRGFVTRGGRNRGSCLKAKAINFPINKLYTNQPIYTRIIPNTSENLNVDNVCNTVFPLEDSDESYIIYSSTVFTDGSISITTTYASDSGIGTYQRGDAKYAILERIFGLLGDEIGFACSSPVYGVNEYPPLLVFTKTLDSFGLSCIDEIVEIVNCYGLNPTGLYVLPFGRPTHCITQRPCNVQSPFYTNEN